MTPQEIRFLADIAKNLHEVKRYILDNLLEVDPEARNRPLQDYVHDVILKINNLDRINAELMFGPLDDDNDEEEPFDWDEQTACTVTSVDAGSVYVRYEGGREHRFNTGDLHVEPRFGRIRGRDGNTYDGWCFDYDLGTDSAGRRMHQIVGNDTKGWIAIDSTTGAQRFIPKSVDQQL